MTSNESHETSESGKSNEWTLFERVDSSATRSTITGDGALLPQPFYGLPTENVHEWTSYFKTYVRYKRLPPNEAVELFKVLARGQLAAWICTLDPSVRDEPAALSKAFYMKYMGSPMRQIRIGKDLFSRRQGPTETVDDFFIAVQLMAQQMDVKVSDDILRHTIMAGLRPTIAGTVMAVGRQTTGLDELLEAARAAELIATSTAAESTSVTDLAREIKRLTERIDNCTVREVRASRSPSPMTRKVHFNQERRSPSPSPARQQQSATSTSRQFSLDEPPYRRQLYNRQREYSNGPRSQQQQQQQMRCTRCNLLHGSFDRCIAMGRRCYGCNGLNHLVKCCFSNRQQNGRNYSQS